MCVCVSGRVAVCLFSARRFKSKCFYKTAFSWIKFCGFLQKCLAQELWQYFAHLEDLCEPALQKSGRNDVYNFQTENSHRIRETDS